MDHEQVEDLTGIWSGKYWYDGGGDSVPFTADIVESSGRFSGTTMEPNTFADIIYEELSADIAGAREGAKLRFTKVYHPIGGAHQAPIFYEGQFDEALTLISGEWSLRDAYGMHAGQFSLSRAVRGALSASRSAAKA
ncbi:MAG: hypothetical protein AAF719_12415 [Pseudomonadota bacterium]